MSLTWLYCGGTPVSDLLLLKGMPLTRLDCGETLVSDLSALRGMPLTDLNCHGMPKLSDLSPLESCGKLRALLLQGTKVTASAVAALKKALPECKIAWDDPAKAAAPPKVSATNVDDPAFQQWMQGVTALPAEKQVQAVVKKLQELNPGFDGKETHKIEGGVVTALSFLSDNVADISPVRALQRLRSLNCNGTYPDKGKLSDLSPLKGMPLTHLQCKYTRVSDLSPLKGMPLTELFCEHTQVSDLSPLKGMPLVSLNCGITPVYDLSPLKGMSLTWLHCGGTHVSNLSPLRGMPLTRLQCDVTPVSDLSPLRGMALTSLECSMTAISDISPLEGMPLTTLGCNGMLKLSDLSPLKGMPLTHLHCGGTQVSDLSPLEGCAKLRGLKLQGTKVTAAAVAALQKALPACKIEWPVEGQFYTPRVASPKTK